MVHLETDLHFKIYFSFLKKNTAERGNRNKVSGFVLRDSSNKLGVCVCLCVCLDLSV